MTDQQNGIYYYFDCMDGIIGERFFTPAEIAQILTGQPEPISEKELIKAAANYEATLYRHEVKDGQISLTTTLYSCWPDG